MRNLLTSVFLLLTTSFNCFSQKQLLGLIQAGGKDGGGVIFNLDGDGNNYTVNHDFSIANPGGRACEDMPAVACNGKLYGLTKIGGIYNQGVLYEYDPATGICEAKHHFERPTGEEPRGSLVLANNGKLYGMTPLGGTIGVGVIFEYDPVTEIYTVKINFNVTMGGYAEEGGMCQHSNGKLYGTTTGGGSLGLGVLFEYDYVTNTYTKKLDFNGTALGSTPKGTPMEASNGNIYGTTSAGGSYSSGVIFEYIPATDTYTRKASLNNSTGAGPLGKLLEYSPGIFYGLGTNGGSGFLGTIWSFNSTTNIVTNHLSFDMTTQGGSPFGGLCKANDGYLYGLLRNGISGTSGNLFRYIPSTNTFSIRHNFLVADGNGYSGMSSLVLAENGKLYGMCEYSEPGAPGMGSGSLFEYDPVTDAFAKKASFGKGSDGSNPYGGLVKTSSGKFFGTTIGGGTADAGVIFEFFPSTNTYIKRYDFIVTVNGLGPGDGLVEASNGKIYGTTKAGGAFNIGVLYEFDPNTYVYTKKIDFNNTNGASPDMNALLLASNNKIYGTTNAGGTAGKGVLFEYDPLSNIYIKKIDFNGTALGSYPAGALMQASNGKLYGVTEAGGTNIGTLFEYTIATSTLVKKINFTGSFPGTKPVGGVVESGGKLYGTTANGGSTGSGTIWEYDYSTSVLTTKYSFNGIPDGFSPNSQMLLASNGKLYGYTKRGGTFAHGTLFEYDALTNIYVKKHDFEPIHGSYYDNNISTTPMSYHMLIEIDAIPLSIAANPNNSSTCLGSSTSFSVSTIGSGISYQWQDSTSAHSWTNISGATSASISVSADTIIMNGNKYRCIATSYSGTIITNAATLTVHSLPVLSCSSSISVCDNAAPLMLMNCLPLTGCYLGPGMMDSMYFDPSLALVGTNLLNYIYTDSLGCTNNTSYTVTVLATPAATTVATNANCFGDCNGTVTCSVIGSGPFTYLWNPGGQTTATISALCTGTYTVTVTGPSGCTTTAIATISQPILLALSNTPINPSCIGMCDGMIAPATGGTAPYSYSGPITGLCSGTYPITVTDAYGCLANASITLTDPPPLTATTSADSVLCFGACDGSATSTPSGIGPFTYLWSPGGQTTQTATSLCPGTYTVMVTRAGGCTATATANVNQPIALSLSTSSVNPTCSGFCNGVINITPSGGTPPYIYTGGTTGLCAGTYTITVTDANGCSANSVVTLTDPLPLTATLTTTDVLCNGNCNGSASALVSGGSPPYSYLWCNGSTAPAITGLCSGSCSVTIYDNEGCSIMVTVVISEPPPLFVNVPTSPDTVCSGSCIMLQAIASGGSLGYTYQWVSSVYLSSSTIANPFCCPAASITYTVSVMDSNGCVASTLSNVYVTPFSGVSYVQSPAIVCDNISSITLSGGSPVGGVYSGTYVTANTFYPATAGPGTYQITYIYSDGAGCYGSDTSNISVSVCTGLEEDLKNANIIVYPNPFHEIIILSGLKTGMEIKLLNSLGKVVFLKIAANEEEEINMEELSTGVYMFVIQTESGVITKKVVKQ